MDKPRIVIRIALAGIRLSLIFAFVVYGLTNSGRYAMYGFALSELALSLHMLYMIKAKGY